MSQIALAHCQIFHKPRSAGPVAIDEDGNNLHPYLLMNLNQSTFNSVRIFDFRKQKVLTSLQEVGRQAGLVQIVWPERGQRS